MIPNKLLINPMTNIRLRLPKNQFEFERRRCSTFQASFELTGIQGIRVNKSTQHDTNSKSSEGKAALKFCERRKMFVTSKTICIILNVILARFSFVSLSEPNEKADEGKRYLLNKKVMYQCAVNMAYCVTRVGGPWLCGYNNTKLVCVDGRLNVWS